MKTIRETETVNGLGFGAPGIVTQARHAESKVCRWPTMAIRELTMAASDSALAADPLFHLGPGATWAGSRCAIGTFVPS